MGLSRFHLAEIEGAVAFLFGMKFYFLKFVNVLFDKNIKTIKILPTGPRFCNSLQTRATLTGVHKVSHSEQI